MKVAIFIPSLANKGPIIVVRDLVNAMVKHSDVTCVVYYLDEIVELEFDCETVKVASPSQVQFEDFDIVHTHMFRPDIYTATRISRFKDVKFISTIHSYMNKDLRNSYGQLISFFATRIWCLMLNRYDKVICLSKDMKQYYSRYIRRDILTHIYNGRNIEKVISENLTISFNEDFQLRELKSKYRLIGGVGNMTKIKGFEQIIEVLKINSRLAAVFIGDGVEKKRLINLSQYFGVSDRCVFLGYKANAVDYYKYFDVYAVTSYSEGFPLVLLEAASYGLPTICSNIPVFREIFNDDEVGFYKLYDIDDLNFCIERILKNASEFSINIQRRFNKSYTAQIMCSNYLSLYQKLVS